MKSTAHLTTEKRSCLKPSQSLSAFQGKVIKSVNLALKWYQNAALSASKKYEAEALWKKICWQLCVHVFSYVYEVCPRKEIRLRTGRFCILNIRKLLEWHDNAIAFFKRVTSAKTKQKTPRLRYDELTAPTWRRYNKLRRKASRFCIWHNTV